MAAWQTSNYSEQLAARLDGRVTLALSCLDPLPKLVKVRNFTADKDQATKAFMATGTAFELYDYMPCTDGGGMSGPKMTPLFQDQCAAAPIRAHRRRCDQLTSGGSLRARAVRARR